MSVIRLAKTGLFRKLVEYEDVPKEIYPELLLHRLVLDKALIDMFSPQRAIKIDVFQWLDIENIDFLDCCEYANLDPIKVYNTFVVIKRILRGRNAKFRPIKKTVGPSKK